MTRLLLWLLLLAGCATPLPPKEVYVKWDTPPCAGPELRRVTFVDTPTPTIACVRAASAFDATRLVIMALIGMPVLACAVTMHYSPDDMNLKPYETTTIYAPISPSLTQVLGTAISFASPNTILEHEIEHAFGAEHGGKCR